MLNLLLPEWFNPWGWTALAIVVAIILVVIIVLVIRGMKKSDAADDEEYDEEEYEEYVEEEPAPQTAAATTESKKSESATAKPVKEEKKVKETEKPVKEEKETKSAGGVKVYHISKRKEDGKWQVKAAKGAKALKLFKTQAEAIEYAKEVAGNQEAKIMIHKVDGSFRPLTYK